MSAAVKDRVLEERGLPETQVTRTEIVSEVKRQWDGGAKPDALGFLAAHPEVAKNRDLAVDLAYEEFCHRREAGEDLDPNEFAARFPYKSTLCRMLAFQFHVEENPHLVPVGDPSGWPQVGENFRGYSVVGELGRGAFARVFLARQKDLGNRLVAIKVSRQGGGAEANILGQLQHDNIVPVHSVEKDPATGWTIVCMPYFGRATLCDVLDGAFATPRPPLAGSALLDAVKDAGGQEPDIALAPPASTLRQGSYVEAVVDIGIQLAEALAFVHARKIYHRDLKPSNVLMGPDGRPRLLDFNLSFDAKSSQQLLGGTLPYMAPEQLRATDQDYAGPPELLDGRSDIYALGVILFELLAGRHPFGPIPWKLPPYQQRTELLKRQAKAPWALRTMNPQVSKALAAVIQRCLAWRQQDRFQDAGELAEGLRRCSAPVVRRGQRLRRWLLAAALLIGGGGTLAVAHFVRQANEPTLQEQGLKAYKEGRFGQAYDFFAKSRFKEGESADVLYWQGRAAMQMGEWSKAKEALLDADKLAPTGKTKACLGYCYMRGNPPEPVNALNYYEAALQKDLVNAAILNNMARCCMEIPGRLKNCNNPAPTQPDAFDYLDQAARLDPNNPTVYQNLAIADFNRSFHLDFSAQVPTAGLAAVTKALELGPPHARFYHHGARLAAIAAQRDPHPNDWKAQSIRYMREAVKHGLPTAELTKDVFLKNVFSGDLIEEAVRNVAVARPLDPALNYLLEPLPQDQ